MGRRHEGGRLLVAGHHQFDRGPPETFDDIEILLAGNPEDSIDTLVFESRNENIRTLHFRSPH